MRVEYPVVIFLHVILADVQLLVQGTILLNLSVEEIAIIILVATVAVYLVVDVPVLLK